MASGRVRRRVPAKLSSMESCRTYCVRCGAENPDFASFCFGCGAQILREPTGRPSSPARSGAAAANAVSAGVPVAALPEIRQWPRRGPSDGHARPVFSAPPDDTAATRGQGAGSSAAALAGRPERPAAGTGSPRAAVGGAISCPLCGLVSPSSADRCDCGRDLREDAGRPCSGGVAYPRVGRRLAAWLIDLAASYVLIFAAAFAMIAVDRRAAADVPRLVSYLIYLGYMIICESVWATTPGKWMFRLSVARDNVVPAPRPLSPERVVLRETVGRFVGMFFFCAGYWTANSRPQRRAWTDRVAGSVVLQHGPPRRLAGALTAVAVITVVSLRLITLGL